MASRSNIEALKRKKLDFNELGGGDTGPYKTGALLSHKRPFEAAVPRRPVDTVLDRGATLPLVDDGDSSSSSSS